MNWNDISAAWERQEGRPMTRPVRAAWESNFEQQRRKRARGLFWRDLREAIAGLAAAVFFACCAWKRRASVAQSWPLVIAVTILTAIVIFFLMERFRARRQRVGPAASLLARLDAELSEMRHQQRLLMNVAKWYLGPIIASWALVLGSIVLTVPHGPPKHLVFLTIYIFLAFMLFGWCYRRNRSCARRFEPQIAELENIRRQISSENLP